MPERRPRLATPVRPVERRRGEPVVPDSWWVRLRSGLLLGCLAAVLGLVAAVLVGIVVLILFVVLQSSVG